VNRIIASTRGRNSNVITVYFWFNAKKSQKYYESKIFAFSIICGPFVEGIYVNMGVIQEGGRE
jgi:hypothetical protein